MSRHMDPDKKFAKSKAAIETGHVGPIPTKLFNKLQIFMGEVNEIGRYECLYNMLVMMKNVEAKELEDDSDH